MLTTDKPTPASITTDKSTGAPTKNEFLQHAERSQSGLVREFWDFLKYNKAWWLTPIVVVLLLVGALAGLVATGVAPLLYTFF
jgi:hypothetical protein